MFFLPIIGIPTSLVREGLVHYTTGDTVARLDPKAIKVCMEIAVSYIRENAEG